MADILKRLKQAKQTSERLREIEYKIKYLESNPISSQTLADMPKSKHYENSTERRIVDLVDELEELRQEQEYLIRERESLCNAIERLADLDERVAVYCIYIEGMEQREAERYLCMKPSVLKKALKRALENLTNLVG